MQFDRDEYAFLSRRGSVPRATRAGPRRRPESEPATPMVRGRGQQSRHGGRPAGLSRASSVVRSRVGSARAFRAGVRATWTAFGAGGHDGFGGR